MSVIEKRGLEMKTKIRLDTITDIANFVLIASQAKPDVYPKFARIPQPLRLGMNCR